jgi:hypothetical protein
MSAHAKKEPPYGSPFALAKPEKPFQRLPSRPPRSDCVARLKSLAPEAAQQVATSRKVIFHTVGDTGGINGTEVQERIASAMQAQIVESEADAKPQFLYLLGDVVYPVGAPESYPDLFYKPFKHYDAPILAIPGNHDGYGRPELRGTSLSGWRMNFLGTLPPEYRFPYRKPMKLPYVFWELETDVVSIIGLYSNIEGFLDNPASTRTPQQDWLVTRFKAAKCALIVTVHHPPYSLDDDHHGSPNILAAIDTAAQSAGRWPDAVFSGHVHCYQRFTRRVSGREIPYVVAGAGGRANKRERLSKLMAWKNHPPVTVPFDTLDFTGNKLGVTLVAADWTDPGFVTVCVDGERNQLHCSYWQVPFDEKQPIAWQDRFTLDLRSHRIRGVS